MYLKTLGWGTFFEQHWNSSTLGLTPARVIEEQRGAYRVAGADGELPAEVTGRFRHAAQDQSSFPAVGDWVAMEVVAGEQKALIHDVLPRRTKLSRKEAGARSFEQILVANVDTVIVVTSLNGDVNPRRVERYLSMIRNGGARPVVALSKVDLCPDSDDISAEIQRIAQGAGVHVLSGLSGQGMEALGPYIGFGETVVLVGSSGVGKSTIINRLLSAEVQVTRDIRASDGRGKHATTSRRLFLMPSGGILIDTPGIRELQLWDAAGLEDIFDDIEELAAGCRFRDCGHGSEPGCAIQRAISTGVFNAERLDAFNKLIRERDHLERRRDLAAQSEQRKHWKRLSRAMKQHYKEKNR